MIKVLTQKEAKQFKEGKLTKRTLLKVWDTIQFEDYLFRYCKIVNNEHEDLNRYTTFLIHGIHLKVHLYKGECLSVTKF